MSRLFLLITPGYTGDSYTRTVPDVLIFHTPLPPSSARSHHAEALGVIVRKEQAFAEDGFIQPAAGIIPGEYASPYKPEQYVKGNYQSEIRNPLIAKILFLSKSIEQFGSGFKRIDSLCKDAGIKYSYENVDNGFKFILYRPQSISDIADVTYDVTYDSSLNDTERQVLAVLRHNPEISREEIADRVSKTVRTVQRALVSLTEKGYIKRIGAKKKSTWEVLR